jgi:hypothetical protein
MIVWWATLDSQAVRDNAASDLKVEFVFIGSPLSK